MGGAPVSFCEMLMAHCSYFLCPVLFDVSMLRELSQWKLNTTSIVLKELTMKKCYFKVSINKVVFGYPLIILWVRSFREPRLSGLGLWDPKFTLALLAPRSAPLSPRYAPLSD